MAAARSSFQRPGSVIARSCLSLLRGRGRCSLSPLIIRHLMCARQPCVRGADIPARGPGAQDVGQKHLLDPGVQGQWGALLTCCPPFCPLVPPGILLPVSTGHPGRTPLHPPGPPCRVPPCPLGLKPVLCLFPAHPSCFPVAPPLGGTGLSIVTATCKVLCFLASVGGPGLAKHQWLLFQLVGYKERLFILIFWQGGTALGIEPS